MNDLRLLTPIEIDDEPRIRDTDLAERLGYERPRKIRELVLRNRSELLTYGGLPYKEAETISPHGGAKPVGRPEMACWLNEGQALLVCMFSQTEKAAEVRKLVIDVFMDWRAGKTVHVREHMRRPPMPAVYLAPSFGFRLFQRQPGDPFTVEANVPLEVAFEMMALYTERMPAVTGPEHSSLLT